MQTVTLEFEEATIPEILDTLNAARDANPQLDDALGQLITKLRAIQAQLGQSIDEEPD
jgi:uncharacterized coiled-coil protein SlyX